MTTLVGVTVYCPCGGRHRLDDAKVEGVKPNRSVTFRCPTNGETMTLNEEPMGIVLRFDGENR